MNAHEVRRGRPTLLNAATADRLVALLAGGTTITDAARALDLDRRTVQNWRRRAWSHDPRDAPFVDLERRVIAALAVAERGTSAVVPRPDPLTYDWEAAAARLEIGNPARWAIPELDEPPDAA